MRMTSLEGKLLFWEGISVSSRRRGTVALIGCTGQGENFFPKCHLRIFSKKTTWVDGICRTVDGLGGLCAMERP